MVINVDDQGNARGADGADLAALEWRIRNDPAARRLRVTGGDSTSQEQLLRITSRLLAAGAESVEVVHTPHQLGVQNELSQAQKKVKLGNTAQPTSSPPPATAAASALTSLPPAATKKPAEQRPLPELVIERVGLHIGGGPNDAKTKEPFHKAVEQRFEDLRACYSEVVDPKKGGTFGVDLFIPAAGGNPEVRQPRTGMAGPKFRQCVLDAFGKVNFHKPPRGPTVISYSIRFKLKD